MHTIDFISIVEEAWNTYDSSRKFTRIEDISAQVSTNHVYRITFPDRNVVIAKLSYYGQYEHFVEDHTIINALSNNLPSPFENFMARSLMRGNHLFVYRHHNPILNAWVVFYRPILIKYRPPRRLDEKQIVKLGQQMALFHQACHVIRKTLPTSSKTLQFDIQHLLQIVNTGYGQYLHGLHQGEIEKQCAIFLENSLRLNEAEFEKIPVFIDWNIGNFSVTKNFTLYSRWDYDWFRMGSRMLDFYFMARVVSDIGDRTVFSYLVNPLMEDRFMLFLKKYHEVFPLTENEIRFLQEAYRFFILNYVIKDGRYFFHEIFASKLQQEAYELYFPSIEKVFNADKILSGLKL